MSGRHNYVLVTDIEEAFPPSSLSSRTRYFLRSVQSHRRRKGEMDAEKGCGTCKSFATEILTDPDPYHRVWTLVSTPLT